MPGLWPIGEKREAGRCLLSRNNFGVRVRVGKSVSNCLSDHLPPLQGLFLFFKKTISLLIFGSAGSPLLCGLLSSCRERVLLSRCDRRASQCGGFSCHASPGSRAQAQ